MEESKPLRFVRANVVENRLYGEEHEPRRGTKHFKGNAKVFVIDGYWGTCDSVTVVGHHRASGRYVKLDMSVRHLNNFRMEVVYSPTVLGLASEHFQDREPYSEEYGQELLLALPGWKEIWVGKIEA